MARKCRRRQCRAELPPVKSSDAIQRAGYCGAVCCREHEMEKAVTRRLTDMPPGKPLERKAPIKKRSSPKNRHGWRSTKYLKWVREQPCCYCGRSPAGEAHHIIGVGAGLSGMGLTAPDQYAMPICRAHHRELHGGSAELQSMQWRWVAETLARAVEESAI